MPTQNVVSTKSGTGFTVDVTLCNLLSDTAIRDFVVLHNGTVHSPATDYTKQSQTSILYSGASLPSTTVEVRRVTPDTELFIDKPGFLQRLSSVLYKTQQDRWLRRFEEAGLNGIGPGSVSTVQVPQDDAFSVTWDGNTTYPATKNALYDKFILMAPLASPAFTGTPTAPTATDLTATTQIATCNYSNTRVANALSNSPVLGGNPTTTLQAASNDSSRIASTAWVWDWWDQRTEVVAYRTGHTTSINVDIPFISMTEVRDNKNAFASDGTRSRFTAPATGTYRMCVAVFGGTGVTAAITYLTYKLNGGANSYVNSTDAGAGVLGNGCAATWALALTANDTVDFQTYIAVAAGTPTISYSVIIDQLV